MAQYALQSSSFAQNQVGTLYNVGLSDGTNSYGYVFVNQGPGQKQGGMLEKTNITDKQAQIQYSSQALIDRDLVYYPRVSQGDFSGGTLQAVFTDPAKSYDTDLEIRTPGYLTLRPAWKRNQIATGAGSAAYQSCTVNNTIYTVNGSTSVYAADASTLVTSPSINAKLCETDGISLILADGVNSLIYYNFTSASWTTVSSSIGAIKQMWFVALGTQSRYLYYTTNNQALFAWDTTSTTTGISIPLKGGFFTIVDVQPYQNGICILTKDINGRGDGDVWFHDGVNLTRIVHLYQETPVGVANCLGSLYVTTQSTGQYESPSLYRIDSGTITRAVRIGSPLAQQSVANVGAPIATGQYVYFALSSPQVNGVTTVNYIGVYDHVTGAYSHLGSLDANDAPSVSQPRQLAVSGRAVAFPMALSGNTHLQYQTNTSLLPAGNKYQTSGTLVSSKYDFGTPTIPKRFRRVEAVHAPLNSGESVQLKAFVDLDPTAYTASLTPTATVTNSTAATAITTLTMGADTVGKTLYFASVLNGPNSSTPAINRFGVEIGGTWVWEFDLDCTAIRRTLSGGDDTQGVSGKDLWFLLRNAYENGNNLTLYLNQGLSYTVTIESLEARAPTYVDHLQSTVHGDQEWLVHAIIKQVA
jgi:hypothetical protein